MGRHCRFEGGRACLQRDCLVLSPFYKPVIEERLNHLAVRTGDVSLFASLTCNHQKLTREYPAWLLHQLRWQFCIDESQRFLDCADRRAETFSSGAHGSWKLHRKSPK
jgi:hypothetical protein